MKCAYCSGPAELVTGREIYPHRPDLHAKPFYRCAPCKAWVGCHPGTTQPLGRLANAQLRRAKSAAHAAFDPIWKSGSMKRSQAYRWLAKQLGMPVKLTHVGWFDVEQCRRVVEACAVSSEVR